jgi:selenocysteine lyase/cysteine desulfurase
MSSMRRREFFKAAGLSLGATAAFARPCERAPEDGGGDELRVGDWASLRAQFPLTRDYVHMATFLLASHPRSVAAAIERHRKALDENPADYWHEHHKGKDASIRAAAAEYTGGSGNQIALTDSTTMGLGLVYNSLRLAPGDEVVAGAQGHYSTLMALQHRTQRDAATVRTVDFYTEPATATVDEIVTRMVASIGERTRALAVTWVHSSTGVKMPIAAMAAALRELNATRDEADRVLLCVDGVHGFGNQAERVEDLGCDVFMAGTHKWMFGPRGTGIIWARPAAWKRFTPIIPSFGPNYLVWYGTLPAAAVPVGDLMTPGGFHSFEHRWALPEAFALHAALGRERVHERIAALNTRCKQGLSELKHVKLHTPMDPGLSAGINCFEVEGVTPDDYVARLHEQGIIASSSPYRVSYPRLAPGLLNDEAEVDRAVRAVAGLKA